MRHASRRTHRRLRTVHHAARRRVHHRKPGGTAVLEPAKVFSREAGWTQVPCPHCGEELEVLVQADEDGQTRYEDCSVCCQSVVLHITWDDGDIQVEADRA